MFLVTSCSSDDNTEDVKPNQKEKQKITFNLSSLDFEISDFKERKASDSGAATNIFKNINTFLYLVYDAEDGHFIKQIFYNYDNMPEGPTFTDELDYGKYNIIIVCDGIVTPEINGGDYKCNFENAYLTITLNSKAYYAKTYVEIGEEPVNTSIHIGRKTSKLVFEIEDFQKLIDNLPSNDYFPFYTITNAPYGIFVKDGATDMSKLYQDGTGGTTDGKFVPYEILPSKDVKITFGYLSRDENSQPKNVVELNSITIPVIEPNKKIVIKGKVYKENKSNLGMTMDIDYDEEIEIPLL